MEFLILITLINCFFLFIIAFQTFSVSSMLTKQHKAHMEQMAKLLEACKRVVVASSPPPPPTPVARRQTTREYLD